MDYGKRNQEHGPRTPRPMDEEAGWYCRAPMHSEGRFDHVAAASTARGILRTARSAAFRCRNDIGLPKRFYGLIADGWDIADTTGEGTRGKLSAASILVEHIVGLLDREQSGGAPALSAAEFNLQINEMIGVDADRTQITDEQLRRVRDLIEELHGQWGLPAVGFDLGSGVQP